MKKLKKAFVLLLSIHFLISLKSVLAQEPTICFEIQGLKMTEKAFSESNKVREMASSLINTKKETYIYIKRVNAIEDFREWYVYSNSKSIQNYFMNNFQQDISKGYTLYMDRATESRFFYDYDGKNKMGIFSALNKMNKNEQPIKLIIIDGDFGFKTDVIKDFSVEPLVLKINSENQKIGGLMLSRIDIINKLKKADANKISIFNLLPQRIQEAEIWGYDNYLAELYTVNGQRINQNINKYGYNINTGRNKVEIIENINFALSNNDFIIIIGESNDARKVLRIPGSNDVITRNDLQNINIPSNKYIIGLICGSENILEGFEGISVIGRIYTDETKKILQFILDKRIPATSVEFLNYGMIDFGNLCEVFPNIPLKSDLHLSAVLLGGKYGELGANVAGIVHNKMETNANEQNNFNKQIVLFYLGILGGISREIIRWKRIFRTKKKDLYLNKKFIVIAIIEIMLGAFISIIFISIENELVRNMVGFTVGVGFEELVRRAAKLKIWIPEVSQGSDENQTKYNSTIKEFLRF